MKKAVLKIVLLSIFSTMIIMMSCKKEDEVLTELHDYTVKIVLTGEKEYFTGNLSLAPSDVNPPISFIDESTNQVVDEGVFPTGTVIDIEQMKPGANSYRAESKMRYLAVVYGIMYDESLDDDPDQSDPTLDVEITLYEDGNEVEKKSFTVDKTNINVTGHFDLP